MKISHSFLIATLLCIGTVCMVAQTQLTELMSADGKAKDMFGSSVAIQGNTMVVGSIFASQRAVGAAYVFVNSGGGWTQVAKLSPSDPGQGQLGAAVAIGTDTIAVGAPRSGPHVAGAVYVFVKPPGGWTDMTETAKLSASDLSVEQIGSRVAIAGDGTKVVSTRPSGGAFVFVKPQSGWISTTDPNFQMSPPPNVLAFATSVAITKDTVVLGTGLSALGQSGVAYVYSLPQNLAGTPKLSPIATLSPSDGTANDDWESVAISGNVIVAGAPHHGTSGAAYVFVEPPSGWSNMTQTAELSVAGIPAQSALGVSVATTGKVVGVGAPGDTIGGNVGQGALFTFLQPPSGWNDSSTPSQTFTATDGAALDGLGTNLAISGKTLVAGTPMHKVNGHFLQGVAYVAP